MPAQKTSKEKLIVQAMQLFRRQGYYNTSIGDLSKACDIPKSHFYYYFPDGKEQLMTEVIQAVRDYFDERIFQIAYQEGSSSGTRWSKIRAKLERIFMNQQGGCIMGLTALETAFIPEEPKFLPAVRSYFEEMILALAQIFAEQLPEEDSRIMAHRSVQDIQGGLMLMQLYKDPQFFLQALDRIDQIFTEG
ncbi:MAG: TetR/AcrR family transcriptional regulator [Bacteroidota bacterium]